MTVYSNIDSETFKWVRSEVETTLDGAQRQLQQHISSGYKDNLHELINQLHQIVGSLQMLELKSLSTLMLESEYLIEDYSQSSSEISLSSFSVLLDNAFSTLSSGFDLIEQGSPERPIEVIELINQIRAVRGKEDIEIGALFSPMIEIFPEVNSKRALKDAEYIERAKALRKLYQVVLLEWLKGKETNSVEKMVLIFDKLSQMSTFGSVSRIWWVAAAYADYLDNNEILNKSVNGRVLRELDDRLRSLEIQGESALVRDPGEELIRTMLLYIAMGSQRTERMDEIASAFNLREYFPALQTEADLTDIKSYPVKLKGLGREINAPLARVRESISQYFEKQPADSALLKVVSEQLKEVIDNTQKHDTQIIVDLLNECNSTVIGLSNNTIENNEDTAFYLASALIYIDSSISHAENFGRNTFRNGQQKLKTLRALNNQEELTADDSEFANDDRQALLDAIGSEVIESIRQVETQVEEFSKNYENVEVLDGADETVRQIKGAVQVLGDQKLSLFLQLVEDQFTQVQRKEVKTTPILIEALAISIGITEEYVKGLQMGRANMDYLLDRGHSDLEVAVGKKVSRSDVETLLDESSDSLFSWLAKQSDFELFTNLKLNLRDLSTLARKTGLNDLDQIIREQNRVVDIISQEPAYLTDNITSNLQNNMVSITEQLLQLYGTEDTEEELAKEADIALKRSAIESDDEGPRIHDAMDVTELGDDIDLEASNDVSVTEIGKQNAVDDEHDALIDDVIFDAFVEESAEILEAAELLHIDCTQNPENIDAVRNLRRAFHTLKGSSRMAGLNNIGEVAWLGESLFNYVLDTEKPLNKPILDFASDALNTIKEHSDQKYVNQHEIDIEAWGIKTEKVPLDDEVDLINSSAPDDSEVEITVAEEEIDDSQAILADAHDLKVDSDPDSNLELLEEVSEVETVFELDKNFEPEESIELKSSVTEDLGVDIEIDTEDNEVIEQEGAITPQTAEINDDESLSLLSFDLELDDINTDVEINFDLKEQSESTDLDTLELNGDNPLEEDDFELLDEHGVDIVELDGKNQHTSFTDALIELQTDDDIEPPSFLALEDPLMRDVFVQEAEASLEKLEEQLNIDEIQIEEDDLFSIAVHTLLGNARTMGLENMAKVYRKVDLYCAYKQQVGGLIDDQDRQAFDRLLIATRECVASRTDSEPYFNCSEETWSQSNEFFQNFLEENEVGETELDEIELDEIELDEIELDEIELDEIELDETELDETDSVLYIFDDENSEIDIQIDVSDSFPEENDRISLDGNLNVDSVIDIDLEGLEANETSDDAIQKQIDEALELEREEELSDKAADLTKSIDGEGVIPERVTAAFEDIELSDELLNDSSQEAIQDLSEDDNLIGFEESLDAFNNNQLTDSATQDQTIEEPEPEPCLLYTSPSPRDRQKSRMPSSA